MKSIFWQNHGIGKLRPYLAKFIKISFLSKMRFKCSLNRFCLSAFPLLNFRHNKLPFKNNEFIVIARCRNFVIKLK